MGCCGNKLLPVTAAALAAWLAACAPTGVPPVPAPPTAVPVGFPAADYRRMEARGEKVLRVDPQRSLVTIVVHRAGSLARLGHDHVVASHSLQGYVAPEKGRADLYLALDELAVDEPELRVEAGLTTQPSPEAIAGTRRNMLDKVLEAERHPFAVIGVRREGEGKLAVSIRLHGQIRSYSVPVRMEMLPEGLVVNGSLDIEQSQFGIVPFAVLGGALQVADRVELRFRIEAGRRA